MNTRNRYRLAGWVIGWLCALPLIPRAEAGFLAEDFEAYGTVPTNVMDIGHGWGASSNTVVVESVAFTNPVAPNQAACVTPGQLMTNAVSMVNDRLWTEAWLVGTNFMTPDSAPPADTSAVFMVALSTNGYLTLCNPTSLEWEVCSTDAANVAIAGTLTTGEWVRVSVFQNYQTRKVAIFLNDRLIRKELPFINTNRATYETLHFDGAGAGAIHVDNVIVSNSTPPGLVSDSDNDGRPDAEELTLFGSLTGWEGSVITASVSNGIGGTVSPLNSGLIRWGAQTNFEVMAGPAYLVDRAWTNGVLVADYSNSLTKAATFTWTDIKADGSLTVGFFYEGTRYVPGDYATLTAALAASREGDRLVIEDGTYNEAVTLSSNLTWVGTNLTGLTAITVQTGVTLTVSGFTNLSVAGGVQVGTNGVLVISNGVVDLGALVLQDGAVVQSYNSTATVNGVQYTGTFTLNENWNAVVTAHPFNLSDTFESYALGTGLKDLGFYGWNASSAAAVVTANPDVAGNTSAQVALAPAGGTISNLMDGTAAAISNIWTDVLIRGAHMEFPEHIDTNVASPVIFFVNTNGFLTVLRPGGWDVCSNDAWGAGAPTISSGEWAQVSWFMDYGQQTAAYFVKGHLVRQGVPFARPAAQYHGLRLDTSLGTAWVDDVNIWTNVPTGLLAGPDSDMNHNGYPDPLEIQRYGMTIDGMPRGSVYTLR